MLAWIVALSAFQELCYFGADSLATVAVHLVATWYGGGRALAYLVLSMAFGNGFLLHPLIGFWLMQHLCHAAPADAPPASSASGAGSSRGGGPALTLQPTVSYSGSALWNWLNCNQLSHVEHHDFSRIPWTKAPELRRTAPEFYGEKGELREIKSVRQLIWRWVFTRGDKLNFACILAAPPPPFGSSIKKDD